MQLAETPASESFIRSWVPVRTGLCHQWVSVHHLPLSFEIIRPRGVGQVTDRDKGVFAFFFNTLWLIASILDSASGNPQLQGSSAMRNMGEVHRERRY